MAFKVKKLDLDLEIDLTEYIPEEEGGILTTQKTDGESINEWTRLCIEEGEKINEQRRKQIREDDDAISLTNLNEISHKSIIKQVDYFYEKGIDFYKPVPDSILSEIIDYLNSQVYPVKKKSKNSKK
jgi:hypothetical protein